MRLGDDFDWLEAGYRRPFYKSGGSGGQFAGLMDALNPLPRNSVQCKLKAADVPRPDFSTGLHEGRGAMRP